ncbi:hypothetical protein [Corynebacterium frankenforstense]
MNAPQNFPELHAHPAPESILDAAASELPDAGAPEARSILSGLACLRQLPLPTAAVLIVQDPDASHVHTRARWRELGRQPSRGARPSALPGPQGSVELVYDERQTTSLGKGTAPDTTIEPVAADAAVDNLIAGLPGVGVAAREDREVAGEGRRTVLGRRLAEPAFVPARAGHERAVLAEVVLTDAWFGLSAREQLSDLLPVVAEVLAAEGLPLGALETEEHAAAEHRLDAEGVTRDERRHLLAGYPLIEHLRSREIGDAAQVDEGGSGTEGAGVGVGATEVADASSAGASARLAGWLAAARLGMERDYPSETHSADLGQALRLAAQLECLCLDCCARSGVAFPEGRGTELLDWWRRRD